jgi:hypothetical protein
MNVVSVSIESSADAQLVCRLMSTSKDGVESKKSFQCSSFESVVVTMHDGTNCTVRPGKVYRCTNTDGGIVLYWLVEIVKLFLGRNRKKTRLSSGGSIASPLFRVQLVREARDVLRSPDRARFSLNGDDLILSEQQVYISMQTITRVEDVAVVVGARDPTNSRKLMACAAVDLQQLSRQMPPKDDDITVLNLVHLALGIAKDEAAFITRDHIQLQPPPLPLIRQGEENKNKKRRIDDQRAQQKRKSSTIVSLFLSSSDDERSD